MKSAKNYNYITPRDFLDFLNHFFKVHSKKRKTLEEEQVHLNNGLENLITTEN
jgi:dynein heavy chain 1